jgi:hypothetical protein
MFNVSHFLIADRYREISIIVPASLTEQELPPKTKWTKIKFWTFLTLNILVPIFSFCASMSWEMTVTVNGKNATHWQFLARDLGWDLTGLLQVVSGIILIRSVFRIKKFFKEMDIENFIDVKILT